MKRPLSTCAGSDIWYVYVYLDPRKSGRYSYEVSCVSFLFEPFYVGKGIGERSRAHLRALTRLDPCVRDQKVDRIRSIHTQLGIVPFIVKVAENLSVRPKTS
jgi:hypothetical protein